MSIPQAHLFVAGTDAEIEQEAVQILSKPGRIMDLIQELDGLHSPKHSPESDDNEGKDDMGIMLNELRIDNKGLIEALDEHKTKIWKLKRSLETTRDEFHDVEANIEELRVRVD